MTVRQYRAPFLSCPHSPLGARPQLRPWRTRARLSPPHGAGARPKGVPPAAVPTRAAGGPPPCGHQRRTCERSPPSPSSLPSRSSVPSCVWNEEAGGGGRGHDREHTGWHHTRQRASVGANAGGWRAGAGAQARKVAPAASRTADGVWARTAGAWPPTHRGRERTERVTGINPRAGGCGAATSAASRGGHTTSAVGSERLDCVGGEPVPMPLLPPHTPARYPWSPTPDVLHLSGVHRPGGGLEGAPRPLTSACVLDWRRTITMVEVGPRTRGGVGGGGGPRVRAPPGERTCGGKQEICRFGSARPLPVEGTLPMVAARRTHRRARVVGVGRRRGGPAAGRWLPAGCPPAAAASGALKRRHGTTSTTSKRKNHSCDPGTGSSPPTTRIPDLLR